MKCFQNHLLQLSREVCCCRSVFDLSTLEKANQAALTHVILQPQLFSSRTRPSSCLTTREVNPQFSEQLRCCFTLWYSEYLSCYITVYAASCSVRQHNRTDEKPLFRTPFLLMVLSVWQEKDILVNMQYEGSEKVNVSSVCTSWAKVTVLPKKTCLH